MNRESRLQHWPETQLCIRKPEKVNHWTGQWALLLERIYPAGQEEVQNE